MLFLIQAGRDSELSLCKNTGAQSHFQRRAEQKNQSVAAGSGIVLRETILKRAPFHCSVNRNCPGKPCLAFTEGLYRRTCDRSISRKEASLDASLQVSFQLHPKNIYVNPVRQRTHLTRGRQDAPASRAFRPWPGGRDGRQVRGEVEPLAARSGSKLAWCPGGGDIGWPCPSTLVPRA